MKISGAVARLCSLAAKISSFLSSQFRMNNEVNKALCSYIVDLICFILCASNFQSESLFWYPLSFCVCTFVNPIVFTLPPPPPPPFHYERRSFKIQLALRIMF